MLKEHRTSRPSATKSVAGGKRFSLPCDTCPKTAPLSCPDSRYCLLLSPHEPSKPKIIRIGSGKTRARRIFEETRIPQDGLRCSIGTALRKTGVKVSSVAVTLKQWWRDVGLCPKPPRATIGTITSTTKHRCRRARPMGHSLSMCKLQHCRHKKSKFYCAN